MERDELLKKVRTIISDKLSISEDQITEEASFIDDLGADSLDTVELVMALEEEFNFEISDAEAEQIKTVEQIINKVKEMAGPKTFHIHVYKVSGKAEVNVEADSEAEAKKIAADIIKENKDLPFGVSDCNHIILAFEGDGK